MRFENGLVTREIMVECGISSLTINAFEKHFPDYEFRAFKPAYAHRKFYLMDKGDDDLQNYNCIFDSIDGIEGFMLGAIKAVTGMLKHNDNWENE